MNQNLSQLVLPMRNTLKTQIMLLLILSILILKHLILNHQPPYRLILNPILNPHNLWILLIYKQITVSDLPFV